MASLSWRLGLNLGVVYVKRGADAPGPAPAGIDIRLLSEGELGQLEADEELNVGKVADVFRRGGGCAAAFDSGRLVGYTCFANEDAPYRDGTWIGVPPQAVHRYNSYVLRSHRGRGIAPALYRYADQIAVRGGREYLVGWTESHNFSSLAAHWAGGRRKLGYILFWHKGRRFLAIRTPAVRRFGFRIYLPDAPAAASPSVPSRADGAEG
jgi:GNAT superfamily N-acetyltransferase